MKTGNVLSIALLTLLLVAMGAAISCDSVVRGGAEVWLENISVEGFSQNGKAVEGIPTGNMSAVLKVSASKVVVDATDDGFTIKLSPSNAVITAKEGKISISGVDPDDIEFKLSSTSSSSD